jgi:hypothetical protein
MKNQYFGDTRDLFKYDLVLELLTRTDLDCFSFIAMLTPPDTTAHGGRTSLAKARAGKDNKDLRGYLELAVDQGRRDIRETAGLFRLPKYGKLQLRIYGKPFDDEARFQYFDGIPSESLKRAVIVLDPDNGLWVRSSRLEGGKYLRYDEARHVYDIMDKKSVLIIFQFIPRVNRITFFNDISMKLKELVTHGRQLVWVSDNQVAFFVLTRDNARYEEVRKVLAEYADWYDLMFGEN